MADGTCPRCGETSSYKSTDMVAVVLRDGCGRCYLRGGGTSTSPMNALANFAPAFGEQHHKAKLNAHQVCEIRAARAAGTEFKELAARFGVCQSTVYAAATGKTWKHLPGAVPRLAIR